MSNFLTYKEQTELEFESAIEEEINGVGMGVLQNGTPYLIQAGITSMCGIYGMEINRIEGSFQKNNYNTDRLKKIKKLLEEQNYTENNLYIKIKGGRKAYPDVVCMALLEYFAFEDPNPRKGALENYRILAKGGFRAYIYLKTGYTPDTKHLNEWKYFLDRVDLLQNKVPQGYF